MSEKYFVYDSNWGFETHDSKEAAIKDAKERLDEQRKWASSEGWDDETGTICWGQIAQQAEERKTGDKIKFDGEMVDCVDYELREI